MARLLNNFDPVESTNLLQISSTGVKGEKVSASAGLTYDSVNVQLQARSTKLDDAVSIGVRRLSTTLMVSVCLWLLSYIMVMLQVIEKGHFVPFTSFLFIPMWIGSVYGFVSITVILIDVCRNCGTLISKERKLFMQAQGVELEQYVDFESLPLMRRLFFWSSVLATFLVLSFTTQIFFYLWLVAGAIGMWHAFYPVLLVFILLFIYLILVKTLSPFTCSCLASSFVGLLLYAAKCKNELGLDWIVTISPIAIVEIFLLNHAVWIIFQAFRRRLSLSIRQSLCVVGYTCSISAAIIAEAITATRDFPLVLSTLKMTQTEVLVVPMILWVGVAVLFCISALAIVQQELDNIADSRGYTDPIPLSRSASGWEVAKSYREITSVLLGVIKIPPPVVSTFRVPRSRSWSSSIPVEQNTNKNETLTRGVSKESSAVCSADNGGWSINNKRNSIEFEGEDEEAQSRGLSADNPGIQSIISDSAVRVRRYITFFVARTSILQTVERSNSNNMLDIEMRESSRNQHRYPITVRVNSGELDGGDEDF